MAVTNTFGGRTVSLVRASLAGFLASLALLAVFALAYGIALALARLLPHGWPVVGVFADWFSGLTQNPLLDLALPNPFEAAALFSVGGVLWGLLYAWWFEPRLSGPEWQRGLTFALVPWAFSLCVFLPLVGGGMLGFGLNAGPLPIIGNLILHAVYGVVLVRLYGPFGELLDSEDQIVSEVQQNALVWCESGALWGLAAGMLLGALVSGTFVLVLGPEHALRVVGMNALGVVVGAVLSGAAVGASAGVLIAGAPNDPSS